MSKEKIERNHGDIVYYYGDPDDACVYINGHWYNHCGIVDDLKADLETAPTEHNIFRDGFWDIFDSVGGKQKQITALSAELLDLKAAIGEDKAQQALDDMDFQSCCSYFKYSRL